MAIRKYINKTKSKFSKYKTKQELIATGNYLNKPQSVIFYTTHKCASVFMNSLFSTVANHSTEYEFKDYASVIWSLGDYIFEFGESYEDFLEKGYDLLYKTKGYIYAPQRMPLDFPGRENFKHIFFLRDPRDVLVSGYYSFGYSHNLPPHGKKRKYSFTENRKNIQEQGIDNYAKEATINWILPVYNQYKFLLESSNSYLYLTYDEFKDNTVNFIQKINYFLDVKIPDNEVKKLAGTAKPIQNKEDINKHQRSGKSKQYKKELNPETIKYLNETLSDILNYWNFATDDF